MSTHATATADAVLQRLLLALPLAARDEGIAIEQLARELGVDPQRVLRDMEEVEGRSFYLPAGLGDQIQITLTREHLDVWTTGEFRRPVRLTPREALALELGLRVVSRSTPKNEHAEMKGLARRLVAELGAPKAEEGDDPAVVLAGLEPDGDPVYSRVESALREGRQLRLTYRPPGRDAASRTVGPLVLAHAEGHWYLLARDLEKEGLRAFRLDRVLEAGELPDPFHRTPEDESAIDRYLQDGRIIDGTSAGGEPFEAVVEYSPAIARWIGERGWDDAEDLADGGMRVRHRVLDAKWLVRHVLGYGAEARVVEPAWMRERVKSAIRPFLAL